MTQRTPSWNKVLLDANSGEIFWNIKKRIPGCTSRLVGLSKNAWTIVVRGLVWPQTWRNGPLQGLDTRRDKRDILHFCTSILPDFSKTEHENEKECITYQNVKKEQQKIVINRTRTSSVRATWANFVVLGAYFGDVSFYDFGQKEQNASCDAHLGWLGFPKMYKSLL